MTAQEIHDLVIQAVEVAVTVGLAIVGFVLVRRAVEAL